MDVLAVFIRENTFLYGIKHLFGNDGRKDIVVCYAAVRMQTYVFFIFEQVV